MPHEDMYDDEPMAPAMKEESTDTESALLPKSFFMGKELEPGKVCKVKVVRVLEDEVEVAYVRHDEDDEGEAEPEVVEVEEEDEMMV